MQYNFEWDPIKARSNSKIMKKEYDFSNAERGKFYSPEATFNLPVYLDDEVLSFIQRIAEKNNTDISTVVNQLIRTDMQIAEVMQ